jgi:polyisoprenoid-binding protein YceI
MAVLAVAGAFALGTPDKPASTSGPSWNVDNRHSDVQLITDGTTDFGKQKINFTLGYGRVSGAFKIDDANLAQSTVELHMYPATAMSAPIAEDGNFKNRWLANTANHTLMCFHSRKIVRTQDGKLQVTGDLVLTRVDRNVQVDPSEAYSGPVYGSPIIHRVSREATFVFDAPASAGKAPGNSGLQTSGSTSTTQEGFPQLVKAVLSTYWPPVVQDEECQNTAAGTEDYRGFQCSGTFMQASGLPPAPVQIGEDYPGASNFNGVVGKELTILVHLRLTTTAGTSAGGGS